MAAHEPSKNLFQPEQEVQIGEKLCLFYWQEQNVNIATAAAKK